MTDITNTTLTTLRPCFSLRMQFPKWAPNWPDGRILVNFSETISRAFEMAYVAPFYTSKPKPIMVPDEALEGRDPNW